MNQAILNKLKSTSELSPDEHDGSYELVMWMRLYWTTTI